MRYTSEDKYIVVGAKGYSTHHNWTDREDEPIEKIEYDEDTGAIRRVRFNGCWWSHNWDRGTIFVQYKTIIRRNK